MEKRYIGIDLHRNRFTCCIRLENGRTYLTDWELEDLGKFVKKVCLNSTHYTNYEAFTTVITRCLDDLPTKHRADMNSLLTHNFQTFENVSILAA